MSYSPFLLKYNQYIQFNEFEHMSTLMLSSLHIKWDNKHTHHLQKFPCVPLLFFIILFQCDFPFTFHFHALEKEMATHSNVLAWRVPGMGEPGGLPSYGVTQSQT